MYKRTWGHTILHIFIVLLGERLKLRLDLVDCLVGKSHGYNHTGVVKYIDNTRILY